MLREKTNKMIDKMNKVMDKVKAKFTMDDMMNMETEEIELLKESMELYNLSIEMAKEQAEVIERLDKTTQELLGINKLLLERTKGL